MTPAQRARWRGLADLELGRGNLLAPALLDCLDELDAQGDIDQTVADALDTMAAAGFPIRGVSDRASEAAEMRRLAALIPPADPPGTDAPAPTVAPAHDLDPGPGGLTFDPDLIETELGQFDESGPRRFFRP